jgi:hypothetical protein
MKHAQGNFDSRNNMHMDSFSSSHLLDNNDISYFSNVEGPKFTLTKSMVQTSNIQTHNLKTPTYAKTIYRYRLVLMLPQTRFKRCGISFLNEVWGGPKRSKKQNSHIVAHRISILKMESKNWWGEGVRGEKT